MPPMVYLRTISRASAMVALATSLAGAQSSRVIASPRGQERIAAIAPPPAPPQSIPNYQLGETVFGSVPAIFTADGRILVNLGYGYEQVARTCPYAYGYGCQSYGYPMAPQTPIFGSYVPPQYVPPTYMPPAYGAPQYPTSYQPYQPPRPDPTGCPPGYVPTGTYPPCVDPYRSAATPLTVPTEGSGPAAVRESPHRAAASSTTSGGAVVVRRR
jgi:hypothetical protein